MFVPNVNIMANKNILKKETKEKFGYSPKELKPNSWKLVVWFCDKCKTKKEKKYVLAIKNSLCLNCSNKKNANTNLELRAKKVKKWLQENGHPLKGTKRPQNVLEELAKGRKKSHEISQLPENKRKLSEKNSGKGNPMYGKKHTEESLIKMRKFQQENKRTGKKCNFYGKQYHSKGSWYICKDGSKVWMRSSWEIKSATYFDEKNIEWLYEPKIFPIKYEYNGEIKEGTYKPDFFIVKEKCYIEIKGWWRDDGFVKYTAFLEQYPKLKIELYDKEKLKEKGIL